MYVIDMLFILRYCSMALDIICCLCFWWDESSFFRFTLNKLDDFGGGGYKVDKRREVLDVAATNGAKRSISLYLNSLLSSDTSFFLSSAVQTSNTSIVHLSSIQLLGN